MTDVVISLPREEKRDTAQVKLYLFYFPAKGGVEARCLVIAQALCTHPTTDQASACGHVAS